ncbi:MAG: MFS transporter [Chloroflexota bacterium]|nr:MFS transporter [Chloroflexota bacterium]
MASEQRTGFGLAATLARRSGVHYAWFIVGLTFVVLLVAAGPRTLAGILIVPLEGEFGWDRASLSLAVAISWVTGGLASPFSGKLVDRFGARGVMIGGLLLTLIGTAAMLTMHSLLELNLWWGIFVAFGSGSLAVVMAAAVANRWFIGRRGLVTGILGAGTSAGQFIFVPLMMGLTVAFGWRAAVGAGALVLLILLPFVLLVMRNGPAEVGSEPYGAEDIPAGSTPAAGPLTPLSEALRTRDFWLLAGSFFVCGFTSNGLVGTHLIPHALEHGFTEATAAGAMALIGAMNIVGTTISGYLTDRFNPRRLLAGYYAFRAASLVLLPAVTDVYGLTMFAILFGLDYIATVPPTSVLTADRFGRRSVGFLLGWIFFAHQIGAGLASYFGGVARVAFGDYTMAFLAAGVLGFVAAGLSLRINTGPRPTSEPVPA